jgi:hypothetical protein
MEQAIRAPSMTLKDHFPVAHSYSPTYGLFLLFLENKSLILFRSYISRSIFFFILLNCVISCEIVFRTIMYNFLPLTLLVKVTVLSSFVICLCVYVCYSFVLVLILQLAVDCCFSTYVNKN